MADVEIEGRASRVAWPDYSFMAPVSARAAAVVQGGWEGVRTSAFLLWVSGGGVQELVPTA